MRGRAIGGEYGAALDTCAMQLEDCYIEWRSCYVPGIRIEEEGRHELSWGPSALPEQRHVRSIRALVGVDLYLVQGTCLHIHLCACV